MSITIQTIEKPWHFLKWKGVNKTSKMVVEGEVTNIQRIVYEMFDADYGSAITLTDKGKTQQLRSRFTYLYASTFLNKRVKVTLNSYQEIESITPFDSDKNTRSEKY